MTIERDVLETDTPFTEKVRERILEWSKIVGDATNSLSVWFRRSAAVIRKSTWLVFVIVVAGNIIAFSYYQERITRYYISVLLVNLVRMNEDMDALDAKVNQLNKKTDDLTAKLGSPASPSSSIMSVSPPSSSPKPRRR
jgi:hypothetical protein